MIFLLLMDEPFGALNPVTRLALQQELARIHRASGKAIMLVTHDIEDALRLAIRIVRLVRGTVAPVSSRSPTPCARPRPDWA